MVQLPLVSEALGLSSQRGFDLEPILIRASLFLNFRSQGLATLSFYILSPSAGREDVYCSDASAL